MKKTFTLIIISLIILASLPAQTPLNQAVDFRIKTIDGESIRLFDLLDDGKTVVVDFFSTSCGPCHLYAPDHQAIYEKYGENTGNVFVVGIAWGDDNTGVYVFDTTYGIEYPTASGSEGGGNIANNDFEIMSRPTLLVITPDRSIAGNLFMPYNQPDFHNIDSVLISTGAIPTSIDDENFPVSAINVFPNPATDFIRISSSADHSATASIRITDLNGRTLMHKNDIHIGRQARIPLDMLQSGIYFIEVIEKPASSRIFKFLKR